MAGEELIGDCHRATAYEVFPTVNDSEQPISNPAAAISGGSLRLHAVAAGAVLLWLSTASAWGAPNVVAAWNALALDAIRFANTPPPAASRQLAILHAAVFDAVNGLDGTYASYRAHTNLAVPTSAAREAVVGAAANRVLRYLYPQFTTTMDAALQAHLATLPDGPEKSAGVAWGRQVAQDLLLERDFDGSNYGVDYRASPQPGRWQPTPVQFASPLLPQWPRLKPFVLERPDQFRSPPPPSLSSAAWAEQMNEVKTVGARNSTHRTPEQTEIAWFWADGVGTETPPGHWNGVA